MWWIFSKKEIIKKFRKVSNENKERDKRISKQSNKFNNLNSQIESNKIKIARLEGAISVLINKSKEKVQSEPIKKANRTEPRKKPISQFERVVISNAKKVLPMALKQAIRGHLARGLRTTDIFKIMVKEKNFCGKTQFYHYLSIARNELDTELRTKVRTNVRTEPIKKN